MLFHKIVDQLALIVFRSLLVTSFQVPDISKHINNIFEYGELTPLHDCFQNGNCRSKVRNEKDMEKHKKFLVYIVNLFIFTPWLGQTAQLNLASKTH